MNNTRRFIFLAKLGIIESTDENGDYEIQRIDDPEDFMDGHDLINFEVVKLKSDKEAQEIFKSITHSQLEGLNQ
jgi:hypothetical protein